VTEATDGGDQLALGDLAPAQARRKARAARKKPSAPPTEASTDPIARVLVDVPLAHLDRPFDYLVTEAQSAEAMPGVRVRVRFSGQLVDGYVLERRASSDHAGRLSRLSSVVSSLPVLAPPIARLSRAVADRYAGTLVDVLRLALPPRHAGAEREHLKALETADRVEEPGQAPTCAPDAWSRYDGGPALLDALRSGASPRAAWCALPSVPGERPQWVLDLADTVVSTVGSDRDSIVVVPDHRDVELLSSEVRGRGLTPVVLTTELGPRERYRRWLEVLLPHPTGERTVVIGTRAAIYAPVRNVGLIVVWDDGDDLHAEPRAPYPHVREVAALRALEEGSALVIGALHRTAEVEAMVQNRFLTPVLAARSQVRAAAPRVRASSDAASDSDPLAAAARLPTAAWRTLREALGRGPVLVQVPRRGYLPRTGCLRCGEPARCAQCQGPLAVPHDREAPSCQWCGRTAVGWRCQVCGGDRLRAHVVGAARTAEELGRAFPGTTVISSGGRDVRPTVGDEPALVIATPGAEPISPGGFAAALLLDAWALLGRPDVRAAEETLRRWMTAAALVRPASQAGQVVVVADAGIRSVQALVRWDPVTFAGAELADRADVGLPPARRIAVLHGEPADVRDLLTRVQLPADTEQLGPVPWRPRRRDQHRQGSVGAVEPAAAAPDEVQVVLRSARRDGLRLAKALAAAQGERSVRKAGGWVRVQVDPVGWG
jgi:primosomal protein N' (replication factor Y)